MTTTQRAVEQVEGPHVLTRDEVGNFEKDGFIRIPGVLSGEELDTAKRYILDLFPRDLVIPPLWYSRKGRIKPFHNGYGEEGRGGHEDNAIYDDPELLPLLCNQKVYDVASQLLGSTELRVQDGTIGFTIRTDDGPINTQPIHVDATVPKENDTFLLTPEELQVGGCFYLTDVLPQGGGLHVVPGGHKLVAEKASHSRAGRQLYERWYNVTDFPPTKEILGNAGDFVMMHHLMPHSASANRLPQPRLTYFVRFIRVDNPYYPSEPAPEHRFNSRQLRAMTPLARRLLGVDPWPEG